MYTVEEAAGLLGVARSTMYELVRAGEVASVRIGRRVFVTAPTIAALTGVMPPPPAELATRRAVEQRPPALATLASDDLHATSSRQATRRSPARDDQPPLFG